MSECEVTGRPVVVLFCDNKMKFTLVPSDDGSSWILHGKATKGGLYSSNNDVEFEVSSTEGGWTATRQTVCDSPASSRALASLMVHVWRWTEFFQTHGIEEVYVTARREREIPWCTWDRDQVIEYLMEFGIDVDEALSEVVCAIKEEGEYICDVCAMASAGTVFSTLGSQARTALRTIQRQRRLRPEANTDEEINDDFFESIKNVL